MPICMIHSVLAILKSQKVSAVVVIPNVQESWWSILKEGEVECFHFAKPNQADVFMSTKRNGNRMFENFQSAFLAVLVNFESVK